MTSHNSLESTDSKRSFLKSMSWVTGSKAFFRSTKGSRGQFSELVSSASSISKQRWHLLFGDQGKSQNVLKELCSLFQPTHRLSGSVWRKISYSFLAGG